MSEADPAILRVAGAVKHFPPATTALSGVDFELRRGEVHALLGENGAGKSTLSRIIAGLLQPDSGTMTLHGRPFAPMDRRDAERAGVRMVMQELNLIPTMTVAESILIDRLPHRFGWIRRDRLNGAALKVLEQVGLGRIDPDVSVGSLGIGQQQLIEIAAGLSAQCQILILDEPTASLTDVEVELLFGQIKRLKDEGVSIIYISHRMEEISRVADRITVLRDGKTAGVRTTTTFDLAELIQLMVGRELVSATGPRVSRTDRPALRVEHLGAGDRVQDDGGSFYRWVNSPPSRWR